MRVTGRTAILVLVRVFVLCLGLGAVGWGAYLLPWFWRQAPLNRLASELLRGYVFSGQVLSDKARELETAESSSFCSPAELHDAEILNVAILNQAIATKDIKRVAAAYLPAYESTRKALLCAPSGSFSWLTLFWLDATQVGVQPNNANYLRLSYSLGPNEGWICLRRNRIVIAAFKQLPADLQNDAIDEFVKLVDTGWAYLDTADIFASAAPEVQTRMIAALKFAKPYPRDVFARTLRDRGIEVKIPGVEAPNRPWQ